MGDLLAGVVFGLLILLFTPSCSVLDREVEEAKRLCASNGDFKMIRPATGFRQAKVVCKDGATFWFPYSRIRSEAKE